MKQLNLTIPVEVLENKAELSFDEQSLIEAAEKTCDQAYAPYSDFKVGAAVKLANGVIVTGSNQENAAYPSGLCAERVAMFYANSQYPDVPVEFIAIIAKNQQGIVDNPIAPCGACRQVLLESEIRYDQTFTILLAGKTAIHKLKSSKDLLPLSFIGDGMDKKAASQ